MPRDGFLTTNPVVFEEETAMTTHNNAARRTRSNPTTENCQLKALNSVRKILPADSKESDGALKASLERHGQLSPIVRLKGEIIDGHRRYRLLKELKRKPWYVDAGLVSPPDSELLGHGFLEINGCRRELNDATKAAMANALANLKKGDNQHSANGVSQAQAAKSLGISTDTMQRVAAIERGDKALHARVLRGQTTIPQAVRILKNAAVVKQVRASLDRKNDIRLTLREMIARKVRFNFLYADPPWDYGVRNEVPTNAGNPGLKYGLMNLPAIMQLPVKEIAAPNAVLWMWTPNCLIDDAIKVMKAWGFDFVTTAVWAKNGGPPSKCAVMPVHETLLLGHRGQGLPLESKGIPSVYATTGKRIHSKKPNWYADQAEKLYRSAAKLELFCRTPRKGWYSMGNQMAQVAGTPATVGPATTRTRSTSKKVRAARVTTRRRSRSKSSSSRRKTHYRKAA